MKANKGEFMVAVMGDLNSEKRRGYCTEHYSVHKIKTRFSPYCVSHRQTGLRIAALEKLEEALDLIEDLENTFPDSSGTIGAAPEGLDIKMREAFAQIGFKWLSNSYKRKQETVTLAKN